VKLPSIDEQDEILKKILPLDHKIEVNNKINETLKTIAKKIFKEWFIDFGPVHAKAEGRVPFGMDDETAALFPDGFEESDLGMIPRGWTAGKVKDVSRFNLRTLSKSDVLDELEYV